MVAMNPENQALCRDCCHPFESSKGMIRMCPLCGSHRIVVDPELHSLLMAHIDCDAFFASVEKRDNPELEGRPVIVGGGKRGVVAACCYVARIQGIRSAMPMFQALKRCPDAVVIPPRMEVYSRVGKEVRALMMETTPLVEPISIDEAFLDLSGTADLHHGSPAQTLVKLINRIENEIGIHASVGLSYNKFLAKIASDLDKPRGFAVINRQGALDFLSGQPVKILWGVGKSLLSQLNKDGITTIGQLKDIEQATLIRRYGIIGKRLYHFSRGEDDRRVEPESETKSISNETTFNEDVSDLEILRKTLWKLCDKVAERMKKSGYLGGNISLKLKTNDFKLLTRTRQCPIPTQLSEEIYRQALPLLEQEADGRFFRLIGIGAGKLSPYSPEQPYNNDLFDQGREHRVQVEAVIDQVRERFGSSVIGKGRGWEKK